MNICVLFLFGVLIYLSFGVYFHFQTFEAVTDSSKKGSLNRCILIQCAIRVFSFLTCFVISVSNAYPSDDDTTSSSSFLQKVQLCIFSFPDFFFVGMYILIVMIWSEGHLKVWFWLHPIAVHEVWDSSHRPILFVLAVKITLVRKQVY